MAIVWSNLPAKVILFLLDAANRFPDMANRSACSGQLRLPPSIGQELVGVGCALREWLRPSAFEVDRVHQDQPSELIDDLARDEIPDLCAGLLFHPPIDGRAGLAGLSRGTKTLTVTATDAFNNSAQAQRTFVYDRKPVLTVTAPWTRRWHVRKSTSQPVVLMTIRSDAQSK